LKDDQTESQAQSDENLDWLSDMMQSTLRLEPPSKPERNQQGKVQRQKKQVRALFDPTHDRDMPRTANFNKQLDVFMGFSYSTYLDDLAKEKTQWKLNQQLRMESETHKVDPYHAQRAAEMEQIKICIHTIWTTGTIRTTATETTESYSDNKFQWNHELAIQEAKRSKNFFHLLKEDIADL
jgi:hypothetical protein